MLWFVFDMHSMLPLLIVFSLAHLLIDRVAER